MVAFTAAGRLVICDQGESLEERDVYRAFQQEHGCAGQLADDTKVLFKVTVDDGSGGAKSKGPKPLVYVGVGQTASLSEAAALFNQRYCDPARGQEGAFLLKGGFGVNPDRQIAGRLFMKHGNELTFQTKVDFSRLAFVQ